MYRRLLPHALEAERTLLGSLLQRPCELEAVVVVLWDEDFFVRWHGEVFAAMMRLHTQGLPVNPVAVQKIARGNVRPLLDRADHGADLVEFAIVIRQMAVLREAVILERSRAWDDSDLDVCKSEPPF